MAISASMQNNILALTAGMFNMSAGGTYLTSFAGYVSGVQNTYNLSDDAAMAELARALVKTDVFKTQMAGKVTADAQANAILSNFGLAGDAALVASTAAAIDSFGTNNTDGELAALIWGYTKALTQDTAAMAKYADATKALAAKVATAVETSVTNPIQSTDMSVLKAAFAAPVAPTTTFTIKTGLDNVTGTTGNDTFSADLAGNSNTFESGDSINGGAGTDKLQIVLGDASNFSISAHTTAIETVAIQTQAVTRDSNNNNMIGTNQIQYSQGSQVDAQNMSGVTRWEDNNSRADLVVEDVRIGATQITKDVTIAMVSTDPGNVDYGVYFDQGSLRAAAPTTSGSTLSIEWMDTRAAIAGQDPLKDISYSGFKFNVDGKSVTVQSAAIDAAATYDALLAAVKAAVAANADLAQFTVAFGADFTAVDTSTGTTAIGKTIALTNTGAGVLTAGSVLTSTNEVPSSSGFHTLAKVGAPATATSIITSTIVLDDVGRGSMGGDLVVGGLSVGDTSTSKGIDRFEITVENNSKLQTINSTNNALKEVQIVNGTTKGDLTVTGNVASVGTGSLTGQTGQTGTIVNNTLVGDDNKALPGSENQHNQYGFSDVRVLDASTMVGKVNVTAELTDKVTAKYMNLTDTQTNTNADDSQFQYKLGTNNDVLKLDISKSNLEVAGATSRDDFNLVISGGEGNDTITTNISGSEANTGTNWYNNSKHSANLAIDAGNGDDTVNTIGGGDFKVTLGAGNDTAYIDNSGTVGGAWVVNATNNNLVDLAGVALAANKVMYKSTVTVTLTGAAGATDGVINPAAAAAVVGFESKAITIQTTDYIANQAQINQAIKTAINSDAVLSKLIEAHDGPDNTVVIKSLVDGAFNQNDLSINLAATDITKLSAVETVGINNAYQTLIHDSKAAALTQADLNGFTAGFAATSTGVLASTNGTTSVAENDSTIDMGTGNDVVVLSTGANSNNSIIYTGYDLGNDTVVNFAVAGSGQDSLNFSSYLKTMQSASGSVASSKLVDTTVNTDATAEANSVTVLKFATSTTDSFGNLTADKLLAAVNNDGVTAAGVNDPAAAAVSANFGGITGATLNAAVGVFPVGTVRDHVVMVESDKNAGEYKIFHLTSKTGDVAGSFNTATLISDTDFGASLGGTANYTNIGSVVKGAPASAINGNSDTTSSTLTASAANVDEGSAVTFTLANQAAGTYNVTVTGTGITTGDYTTVTSVTVGADGTGTFAIDATADATTEGAETMLVSVAGLSQSVVINDTSLNGTPTASVAVTTTGSVTDTADINTTYTVTAGTTYTYNIAGFGAGDKLVFPAGNTPSVNQETWDDGIVDLAYASNGTTTTIHLTGLSTANDGALNDLAGFNTVFGAGTIA